MRKADARTRTGDPFITSEVLYQLSYVGAETSIATAEPENSSWKRPVPLLAVGARAAVSGLELASGRLGAQATISPVGA